LVQADPTEQGDAVARAVKASIVHLADILKLRRKLARVLRQWALYRLGVLKISWDVNLRQIKLDVVNARRLILDKDGYIDEGGHFIGEYVGEKKKATAQVLSELFPKKKAEIIVKAGGKMGTKLEYYEWWYRGTDVFYTLGQDDAIVLGKFKNPNWNYDVPAVEGKEPVFDDEGLTKEEGLQAQPARPGQNHMKVREAPYVFFSVFSVGLHPHDETSLILQNITLQDLINRRMRQIDRNVEGMNNGLIVSGKSFTEDQAANAASALRRGQAIRVPDGNVETAAKRFPPERLPPDVFQNMQDTRNELSSIFGTSGSTPDALQKQDTVRGKIMVNQQDASRIGGGITEQLEQIVDTVYNWFVQFMFVYYDEEQYVLAAGSQGGHELMGVKNTNFILLKTLDITVKEGSLIPKDPLTQRNEAIDLWSANAIDPLTFYKRLDFPDPMQQTNQLILWQMFQKGQVPPQAYLPSFTIAPEGQMAIAQQQQAMAMQQPGTGGNAVSPPQNSPPPEGNPKPAPQSQEAVQNQSQQLLGAIPIPRQ
jgi:hypothetical protein